jgi:dolichyl-phosphate-mannose-protein mannosyltransferase
MHPLRSRWPAAVVAGAIIILAARAAATHRVFTHTVDEPFHIGTGMEVIQYNTYTLARSAILFQPPLCRVVLAAGPYLQGCRLVPEPDREAVVKKALYSGGDYWTALRLARLPVLLFAAATLLIVYRWLSRISKWTGAAAVTILAFEPSFTGHAGLATLDVPSSASIVAGAYALRRYLERPSRSTAAIFAIIFGLGTAIKFTMFFFMPALTILFLVYDRGAVLAKLRAREGGRSGARALLRHAALVCALAALAIWAGYGFQTAPFRTPDERPHDFLDKLSLGSAVVRNALYAAIESPFPASAFVDGLYSAFRLNAGGYGSYLLGEYSRGWWYYFPVVLALKLTLPMIVLILLGCAVLPAIDRAKRREANFFLIAAGSYLVLTMATSLNIGFRHLMPMLPFLAGIAALPFTPGLRAGERLVRAIRIAAIVLLAGHAAESVRVHPDYIAYFNSFVPHGREHEYLLDSNLDWGQDIDRLSRVVARRGIDSLGVLCLTNADLAKHGIHAVDGDWTSPEAARGWLAISAHMLKGVTQLPHDKYAWLEDVEPVERIGKSIFLYRFPEEPAR